MVKIYPLDDQLILEYQPEQDLQFMLDQFKQGEIFRIRKTFSFKKHDVLDQHLLEIIDGQQAEKDVSEMNVFNFFEKDKVRFLMGTSEGEYFKVVPGTVTHMHILYLHKKLKFDPKLFVSHMNISIFSKMERYTNSDIYIGGEYPSAIPEPVMWELVKKFPSTQQKKLYEAAMITTIIREYLDNVTDYREKYEKYLNKKMGTKESELTQILKEQEVFKYKLILEKLETMLNTEQNYTEAHWQNQILAIITLLYPKYIHAFKSVAISRKNQTSLFVDILLLDSEGYVDVIEIKKPSGSSIVSSGTYRNNYIPYRELSGTLMQIEKYIYHLNRWGADGEEKLTQKLGEEIQGLSVKLTNPGGLVIMGRDHNLSAEQRSDFEVVKRKYKNILDILTYDELIRRLKFTVSLWEKQDLGNS